MTVLRRQVRPIRTLPSELALHIVVVGLAEVAELGETLGEIFTPEEEDIIMMSAIGTTTLEMFVIACTGHGVAPVNLCGEIGISGMIGILTGETAMIAFRVSSEERRSHDDMILT